MTTPAAREREVWRDFRQAQAQALKRSAWENPLRYSWRLLLAIGTLILISVLDAGAWSDVPFQELHPMLDPPAWLVVVFLLVLPLNGWLAHVAISYRTPRDQERPTWLRILRFTIACLLPMGAWIVTLYWRDLLNKDPSWAATRSGHPGRLSLRAGLSTLSSRLFLDQLCRSAPVSSSFVTASIFTFILGALFLLQAGGTMSKRFAIVLSIGLHILCFFGAVSFEDMALRQNTGRLWEATVRASRWALLIPFPFVWIPGFLFLFSATTGGTRRTLTGDLYLLHQDAGRHLAWRRVELGHAPLRTRGGAGSRASIRRSALSRVAIFLLIPEAGWLTWLLAVPGGRMALFEPVLVPALLAAIALLSSSFLLQGLPPIARRFRWKRIENSLNLYLHHGVLLLPAALVLGGCAGGLLAAKGEIQTLGGWIEFAAQIILLQGVLSIFPAASGEISRFDIWLLPIATVLSLAFDVLGKVLKVDPAFAERSVFLVQAIPLLGLLAGLALLPALLRPFTWRHIFDRRLPFGFRTVLTVLALTAILPLGGLAVPFWIWARQRLWPRYAITSLLSSTRISR